MIRSTCGKIHCVFAFCGGYFLTDKPGVVSVERVSFCNINPIVNIPQQLKNPCKELIKKVKFKRIDRVRYSSLTSEPSSQEIFQSTGKFCLHQIQIPRNVCFPYINALNGRKFNSLKHRFIATLSLVFGNSSNQSR